MTFGQWLSKSNEAKPFRDAFECVDNIPLEFGLRTACFQAVQAKVEKAWSETKRDLQIDEA